MELSDSEGNSMKVSIGGKNDAGIDVSGFLTTVALANLNLRAVPLVNDC